MHKPIQFESIGLSFPHKTCFADFTGQIPYGSRIAIMGRNGTGKSTLLKMLAGLQTAIDGCLDTPKVMRIGYVPQIIDAFDSLSGGQRFNKALSEALTLDPELLLLDEPTNHLDNHNRQSLMRMLRSFAGTLVMVTHDVELLRSSVDVLWHIDNGRVQVFIGCYDDYIREVAIQKNALETELFALSRQKRQAHDALMQEQSRAKKSRVRGEKHIQQRKWPTIVSQSKARNAQETSGRKKSAINQEKHEVTARLSELVIPEIIKPKFNLPGMQSNQTLVTITDGQVGYHPHHWILQNLRFSIQSQDRIALLGRNGSGKSTLIQAVLNEQSMTRIGDWILPKSDDIGYLDQHYATLSPDKTVMETIRCLWSKHADADIRKHLNDFLFRKNEEVTALVSSLSGGEKARLSLAQIAAKTPKLLILDEMTNNLDLETRAHVIEVLKYYPGALLVISHDTDFLEAIGATERYRIEDGLLHLMV